MAELTLKLLGGFELLCRGQAVQPQPGKKARALLCYLALLDGRPCPREKLASLLWGDRFDEQARHSLRQAVSALRKALGDTDGSVLVSDDDRLSLNPERFDIDVAEFEGLAAADATTGLEQAAAAYRGDLLDGTGGIAEEFDEWLGVEQARLRHLAADVLGSLMARQAEAGKTDHVVETAQRLLTLDPLREDAHRLLMQAYNAQGRRAAALRQFQACRDLLQQEVGAEPEPATVQVYDEIREGDEAKDEVSTLGEAARPAPAGSRPRLRTAVVVSVIFLIGAAGWLTADRVFRPPPTEGVGQTLPEKPSIAILPFRDLSDPPVEDGFVSGITEEITTALSMISDLFVIAGATTLTYKGRQVEADQIARELGIRYVLQGSVQRSAKRVRVAVQLIDAVAGQQIWAHLYDGDVEEVFELHDRVTLEVVNALQVEMTEGEQARIALLKGTDDLQTWILAGRALEHLRKLTRADNQRARELYRRAIDRDDRYPGGWLGIAWTHFLDARFGWTQTHVESVQRAAELAERALALDPDRANTYSLLGAIELLRGDHDRAVVLGEKAVSLSPSGAEVAALLAYSLTYTGDLDRSVALTRRAMRLSPIYPDWYRWNLGRAYRLLGRYDEAIAVLSPGLADNLSALVPRVELAAAYSEMGTLSEARRQVAAILRIEPGFSTRAWLSAPPYRDQELAERERRVLTQAGLPD